MSVVHRIRNAVTGRWASAADAAASPATTVAETLQTGHLTRDVTISAGTSARDAYRTINQQLR